jgi:hypothetical protein
MSKQFSIARLKDNSRAVALWTQAAVLAFAAVLPALVTGNASAAQLTNRSVTISSSQSAETGVTYNFGFTVPTGGDTAVQGLMFEFCTTPLGPCTLPNGMNVTPATVSVGTQTGFPNNTTAFAEVSADTGDCDVATDNTKYCVNRTEAATTSGATPLELELLDVTNPTLGGAESYRTIYVRISLYDDNGFTTRVHDGTVAAAVNRQLVVTGRVQERLEFCVAAVAQGDAMPASCSAAPLTTTIDIGVIDNISIAKAPAVADPITGANNSYGIAMINTNASNGAIIQFIPIEASTGTEKLQNFRVNGATCDVGASSTDQCFEEANGAAAMVAGTEGFGMAVGCILPNGTTTNLGFSDVNFDGNADANCGNAGNNAADRFSGVANYGWVTGATPVTIAESSSVLDDEILHLTFAATAAATTPTGAYSVTSMYIATPTF